MFAFMGMVNAQTQSSSSRNFGTRLCVWCVQVSGALLIITAALKIFEPWHLRDWIWSEARVAMPAANGIAAVILLAEAFIGYLVAVAPRRYALWAVGCWGAFTGIHVWQLIKSPTVGCPCLPQSMTVIDGALGHTVMLILCLFFTLVSFSVNDQWFRHVSDKEK